MWMLTNRQTFINFTTFVSKLYPACLTSESTCTDTCLFIWQGKKIIQQTTIPHEVTLWLVVPLRDSARNTGWISTKLAKRMGSEPRKSSSASSSLLYRGLVCFLWIHFQLMPINKDEKLVYHSDSEAQSPQSLDPETTLSFTLQTDLVPDERYQIPDEKNRSTTHVDCWTKIYCENWHSLS